MAKKLYEETNIQDIANALREVNGTETKYKTSEMGDAVRAVGGKVIDLSRYIKKCNGMFQGADFTDNPNIILNFEQYENTSFTELFYGAIGIESVKLICKQLTAETRAFFYNNKDIKTIDLTEFYVTSTSLSNAFKDCQALVSILGNITMTDNISSVFDVFGNCYELIDVSFTPFTIPKSISFVHSSKLSDESIQSIIDGLADLTGQTTQTLTFNATVKSKLTEEQIATITSKNWTLA